MTATILTSQIMAKVFSGVPDIYNLELTNADTEYSFSLPAGTLKFVLQCRTADDIKLAFKSGESGTKYVTIHSRQAFSQMLLETEPPALYLQSGTAGVVVEILVWTR